ncbi:glycosyltransferase family 2 protein [Hyunsoonleella sp. 2307UL5-6]|uniref:glycosyltransferase family 2 protein n=1 Tax=Hyunsoonleella sp. 2307UL5-6 TaxID=3384768 RepID=UPI0039BC2EF9
MIIIAHQHNKTLKVLNSDMQEIDMSSTIVSPTIMLKRVSQKFPNALIVWCHINYLNDLNIKALSSIFHHKRILATFTPQKDSFLQKKIGYIERSFFIKINKKISYPTWLMSSNVGGVYAEIINTLNSDLKFNTDLDYFLNSLAKRYMVEGLFCYSEPNLLHKNVEPKTKIVQASTYSYFKFTKQHYKWVWVWFLFGCYLIYEKRLKLFPLLKSLFYKQLHVDFNLEQIEIKSNNKILNKKSIDVIIPTIGRKKYLYDILKDLSQQTLMPKKVIVVEQNPTEDSISKLDYLNNENWPFKLKHVFTNKTGVCNARNIALEYIENEWVFFADDDIRIGFDFFETSFHEILNYGVSVASYACLLPKQIQTYLKTHQTTVFGAGSSMVKSSVLQGKRFNILYEHGFGEDNDFGMQLRNKGHDIIYFSDIKITHLKAPIGGYRTKIKQPWEDDEIQPKPSPTIQLLYQTYFTKQQLLGYKLLLGLQSYKNGQERNPFKFANHFKKQWQQSLNWYAKLQTKL